MSALRRLFRGETDLDFLSWRWWGFAFSALLIVAGALSLGTRGLDLGIEFEGGVAWQVEAPDVSVSDARDALRGVGLGDAKIQILGGDTLRVQAGEAAIDEREEVTELLADLGDTDVNAVSVNEVGPSWGDEISDKAERALVYFLIAIAIYITLRFEWRMAVAALVAVAHDILVTVGVYSLGGWEVTPATVIAFLTILGYSLYDTIVVFDKVRENASMLGTRTTYSNLVNLSMNEVLMRSVNTTITSLLPVLSILFVGASLLGALTLQEFAIALLVGLGIGAYSSIFVAAPILASLKERDPRYAAARRRAEAAGGGAERSVLTPSGRPSAPADTPAGAARGGPAAEPAVSFEEDAGDGARRVPPSAVGPYGGVTPRGRKKRRGKRG